MSTKSATVELLFLYLSFTFKSIYLPFPLTKILFFLVLQSPNSNNRHGSVCHVVALPSVCICFSLDSEISLILSYHRGHLCYFLYICMQKT
jgi:hypothetical protein